MQNISSFDCLSIFVHENFAKPIITFFEIAQKRTNSIEQATEQELTEPKT